MQKAKCFRPDLRFQTRAEDYGVQGIFAPHYICCWEWVGKVLPSTLLGHWHSAWATGAFIPFH